MALNTSTERKHIWVITGPAGCGKTSVAESLHQTFNFPFLEGDTVSLPQSSYPPFPQTRLVKEIPKTEKYS